MDKHFDYCVLRKNNGTTYVTLFNSNNTVHHYLLTETGLRNVQIRVPFLSPDQNSDTNAPSSLSLPPNV